MTITITLLIFAGCPAIEPQNADAGFTVVVESAVDEPEQAWPQLTASTTARARMLCCRRCENGGRCRRAMPDPPLAPTTLLVDGSLMMHCTLSPVCRDR